MAVYKAPAGGREYRKVYTGFNGVDLVSDAVNVAENKFSDCRNIMLDKSGLPEKRYGYRAVYASLGRTVHSMKAVELKGESFIAIHAGKHLYKYDGESLSMLKSSRLCDCNSDMFCSKDRIWIFSEQGVFVYYDNNIHSASEIAYIPVTSALRNYQTIRHRDNSSTSVEYENYTDAGGTLEKVNLLTAKRINTFALDDFLTNYHYSNYVAVSELYVDSNIVSLEKAEFLNSEGEWTDVTAYATFYDKRVVFRSDNLPPAPYMTQTPLENVRITFTADIDADDKISGCRFGTFFGEGDDGRLFLSGNSAYPNYEWYSEYGDLTYFPDMNYCVVGSDSAIVGYSKLGDSLVIFKTQTADDSAIYLQNAEFTSDGTPYFVLRQCYSEVGALSHRAITEVGGVPHFVTADGVYAIVANGITSEKSLVNKSRYVNPMLTEDAGLSKAALYRYKNLLFCSTGGNCYVFCTDTASASGGYNAFVWDGIPAKMFVSLKGDLYFATEDGMLYRFNTDDNDIARFNDYPAFNSKAVAIRAYFTTALDDDGSFMARKTMVKKGCGIMVKPYIQSSVKVFVLTDEKYDKKIMEKGAAIFDFDSVYFDVVDFSTRDTPRILPFNTSIKRYSALQFRVENSELNQGFGVFGIEKRYTFGNYKKY